MMMSHPPVGNALQTRIDEGFHEVIPSIAIDSKGTLTMDDFISYSIDSQDRLVRKVSILDVGDISHSKTVLHKNSVRSFLSNEDRGNGMPKDIFRDFDIGSHIPTITFEHVFGRNGEIDFNIYKSTVLLTGAFKSVDIDRAFKSGDNALVKAVEMDPLLRDICETDTPNHFGYKFLRAVLGQTNSATLEWARKNGVDLIVHHRDVDMGNEKYYWLDGGDRLADEVMVTCPVRSYSAYINQILISDYIRGNDDGLSFDVVERVISKMNSNALKNSAKFLPSEDLKCSEEELDRFMEHLGKKDLGAARTMIEESKTDLASKAFRVATDKSKSLGLPWDISRIRDTVVTGRSALRFSQAVIYTSDGKEVLKGDIQESSRSSRFKSKIEASKDFWLKYFDDPSLSSDSWRDSEDLFDFKDRLTRQYERGDKTYFSR